MSDHITIGPGQLSGAIQAILEEYGDRATEVIREEAPKAAKKAAKELRGTSPARFGGYAKGWTAKSEETVFGASAVAYNGRFPGLPHLLEYGHALRGGGRSGAFVHIAPVNEQAQRDYLEAVRKGLGNIS